VNCRSEGPIAYDETAFLLLLVLTSFIEAIASSGEDFIYNCEETFTSCRPYRGSACLKK
jgi:hypothetical protein